MLIAPTLCGIQAVETFAWAFLLGVSFKERQHTLFRNICWVIGIFCRLCLDCWQWAVLCRVLLCGIECFRYIYIYQHMELSLLQIIYDNYEDNAILWEFDIWMDVQCNSPVNDILKASIPDLRKLLDRTWILKCFVRWFPYATPDVSSGISFLVKWRRGDDFYFLYQLHTNRSVYYFPLWC